MIYYFGEVGSTVKILGLTGPSGAGKSELCRALETRGLPSINADEVYHSLLYPNSPCVKAIAERFGGAVLDENGNLNRAALASVVFSADGNEKLEELNRITHAFVIPEMLEKLGEFEKSDVDAVICDVPLLFESGFDKKCDFTVAVLANADERVKRIVARDKISEIAAKNRVSAQKNDEFYTSRADIVIKNEEKGLASLEKGADAIISLIKGGKI